MTSNCETEAKHEKQKKQHERRRLDARRRQLARTSARTEPVKKSSARFSLTEYDDGVAFLPQRLSIGDMVEVFSAGSAKMWKNETHSGSATAGVLKFSTCCNQGKVVLPPISDAPVVLQNLMLDTTPEAKGFRDNIRAYNSSLAFTSLGAKTPAVHGHGPPVFHIQGTVYHRRRVDTKTESCPVPIEAEVVVINHDHSIFEKIGIGNPASEREDETARPHQSMADAVRLAYDAIDNSMHCKLCKKT